MKRLIVTFALLIIIGGMGAIGWNTWNNFRETKTDSGKRYAIITSQQLISMLKEKDLQIIDLRESTLFNKGHIPGAMNIPFDQFKNRISEVSTTKPIIFVCHTGPMGDVTSQMMVKKGGTRVFNLKGGMADWNGPLAT